jgi:hypothetical protein
MSQSLILVDVLFLHIPCVEEKEKKKKRKEKPPWGRRVFWGQTHLAGCVVGCSC